MSFDIREHKKRQRAHFKQLRAQITPKQKARWDTAIIRHLLKLEPYLKCTTLLGYMPLEGEIDVLPLLERAWEQGKQVALPYCLPQQYGIMEFYLVSGVGELITGVHGGLEPNPELHQKLASFDGCFCLVPGYVFDADGYRLGYGGGYYDRFLNGPYSGGLTAGAVYGVCTVRRLTRGTYDCPCDYVVTETGARHIKPMPKGSD